MTMSTEESLREYLRIHLRRPIVTKIGPLAAAFDFVADAAPGVREVLAVGKVCWEVRENHYDLVVADADASGHVVSQIASPRTIADLVPRGPLRDQTSWMLDILDDPARCGVVVVANPEELAVGETVSLATRLRADTRTDIARIVMNRTEPEPGEMAVRLASDGWFSAAAPEAAYAVVAASARHGAHAEQTQKLRALLPEVECVTVPRLDASGAALAEAVAEFVS
jgi:anion-transporting  ArsA/GET3 family ATPase